MSERILTKEVKRLIVTVLAALALSTAIVVSSKSANAATRDIAKSGAWTAYAGTTNDKNIPLCGMFVEGGGKSLHIKYAQGWKFFNVVGWKKGWSIPDNTKLSVTLGFDKGTFGEATATGWRSPQEIRNDLGDYIAFQIGGDMMIEFLSEFQAANKMWLRFDSGTETPWIADMTGSREIGGVFARCVKALLPSGSQPYGKQPETSQPYSTQPHGPFLQASLFAISLAHISASTCC